MSGPTWEFEMKASTSRRERVSTMVMNRCCTACWKLLRTSLERLPEAQREVIALAFYVELSHSEIAVHLDLPTGTVKGRMRLGLHKLNTELEHHGAESPAAA